jgi:hypothetical protein
MALPRIAPQSARSELATGTALNMGNSPLESLGLRTGSMFDRTALLADLDEIAAPEAPWDRWRDSDPLLDARHPGEEEEEFDEEFEDDEDEEFDEFEEEEEDIDEEFEDDEDEDIDDEIDEEIDDIDIDEDEEDDFDDDEEFDDLDEEDEEEDID